VKKAPDSGWAAAEREQRSLHARMILARTFQRREEIDFDWYLGKADAALHGLNQAGWRIVRAHDSWPGDNGGICMLVDEEWTL
jgi:hypothetical protein